MGFLRLQTTRSDGEVETYHLKAVRRYVIGRGSSCQVRILDMRLSRSHFAIEPVDENWRIVDEGSTNGLLHNGTRLTEPRMLHTGDAIKAGGTEMRVTGISEHLDLDAPVLEAELRADTADSDRSDAKLVTTRDLNADLSPAEAHPVVADDDEQSAIYVKLLGKRVGPLNRTVARDLKKRELLGKLQEDDIAPYLS